MKRYIQSLIATTLLALLAACGGSEAPASGGKSDEGPQRSYFFGGRLIPGDGSPAIEDVNIVVENGKITGIGKKGELQPPRGAEHVDLAGRTITPVFTNVHAHLGLSNGPSFSSSNYSRTSVTNDLNRYLYYGVGAVGSLGTDRGDVAFEIRDEQRKGELIGARLYTAGRGIAMRGGAPAGLGDIPIEVSNAGEARKAVAAEAERKVDLISFWVDNDGKGSRMPQDVYRAIIDEAHQQNLKAVAHVFSLADAKDLVDKGVDGLVQSIRDREVDDQLISAMKSKNVFLAPALTAAEAKFVYADKPAWLGEQLMREAYPAQLSAYLADTITMNKFRRNTELSALKQQYETAKKNLKKMADAGVKIALGTDSGSADTYPGYFEIREMMLMAEAGMSPESIITAATSVSAGILGATDIGTAAVGKTGNFLTFSNNPAAKIENVKDIVSLYINGSMVERSGLVDNIEVIVPKITQQDRAKDAEANRQAQIEAQEKNEKHYGDFVLAPKSASVRSMSIPMPKIGGVSAKFDVRPGPPDRITVSFRGTAAQLRGFYVDALPAYRWKPSGNCFERPHPSTQKTQVLCIDASANSAVLNITEKG